LHVAHTAFVFSTAAWVNKVNSRTDVLNANSGRLADALISDNTPRDFLAVLGVVSLSLLEPIVNHDERRHEVDQLTGGKHGKVRARVATSVAVTARQLSRKSLFSHCVHFSHQATRSVTIEYAVRAGKTVVTAR